MKGFYLYAAVSAMLTMFLAYHFLWITLIVVLSYAVFLYLRCPRYVFILCVLIGSFFFGLFHLFLFHHQTSISSNQTIFTGQISSIPNIDGSQVRFFFSTQGEEVSVVYYMKSESEVKQVQSLMIYDRCMLKGKLSSFEERRNPNAFNYKGYMDTKHVHWKLKASTFTPSLCHPSKQLSFLQRLSIYRQHGIDYLQKNVPQPASSFMQALIYGERSQIDSDLLQLYQSFGLIHLLAISGLHVGLMTFMFFYVLIRMGMTRQLATNILLVTLPLYAIIAGGAPSVIRAVLMSMLALASTKYQKKISLTDSIALAFLLMIAVNPFYILQVGFQLSFVVTLFIVLSAQVILKRITSTMGQLLLVSFIAQLGSLPLLLFYFYEVSLLSLPLNMIYVPLFSTVILPLCLFIFTTSFFFLPIAAIGQWILNNVLLLSEWFLQRIHNLSPVFVVTTGKLSLWVVGLLYIAIYSVLWSIEKKKYTSFFSIVTVLILVVQCLFPYVNPYGKVTMIDVGQGDSLLIELPYRRGVYLIDTGGSVLFSSEGWQVRRDLFDVGKDIVMPVLKSKGIGKVNKLLITHGDYDHGGSASTLLDQVKIEQVVLGKKKQLTDLEVNIIEQARKANSKISYVKKGDYWKQGDTSFYILSPTGTETTSNNSSIVLFTELGGISWLFTGDLEEAGEAEILRTIPSIQADVLKVAHHGSKSSTSPAFLRALNPQIALISAGKKNRYGHPHNEVVERLQEANVFIYRTDENGAITYTFRKNKGTFYTELP
ncbi:MULTISPECIES: DNA internalization-related competence protein ComEC/Rec2 [Bacillaceae]|uniref:DNA internalization-related competence protein ComEC/Rec2 n=1 Tax=Bacillaceae TaxID=186817 RepID=UPI001044E00D|nr:DNA internalization-related competence protein ComEC/Rec2 [Bacillus sp. CBEL-1]TDB50842.1 DNA internalization-related competence protein ComEC/Rec2 [Bacillus sp. CBEL-1]